MILSGVLTGSIRLCKPGKTIKAELADLAARTVHIRFAITHQGTCQHMNMGAMHNMRYLKQQQTDWQSFQAYIESLDPALQRLLGNLTDQDIDVEFWTAALQSGIVATASDGSAKDG
eukprot:10385543-Ditylum_brightwellii.AAC.1